MPYDVSPGNDDDPVSVVLDDTRRQRMKRSKFSERQVASALRQAEVGTRIAMSAGSSESATRRSASEEAVRHLGLATVRHLRQLEGRKYTRRHHRGADLTLAKEMRVETPRKKSDASRQTRRAEGHAVPPRRLPVTGLIATSGATRSPTFRASPTQSTS